MRTPRSRINHASAALAIVLASVASVLLAVSPAQADSGTSVEFTGESAVTVPFGSPWSLTLQLVGMQNGGEGSLPDRALGTKDGTISVSVSGIGTALASGIPIQADGRAYVTQPLDKPLLPAGDYQVTAIFSPSSGTMWSTSQTTVPATLTVTPLALTGKVVVVSDPTVSSHPYIEARLGGEYVKTVSGAPSGTWSFVLSDGSTEVYQTTVAQVEGSAGPLQVDIPTELRSGRDFTLRSEFTPVAEIAGGVELGRITNAQYRTPSSGLLGTLASKVPFPIWATLALSGLIVVLVALVIVLGVKLSRRGAPQPTDPSASVDEMPEVEIVDMEFVGISPQQDGPAHWALSDDDAEVAQVETEKNA